MGANVIVTEVDSVKALEAVMDGFRVMPMNEAATIADLICTVTGNKNVVDKHHFESIKDGCILSNSGHFNVELNLKALQELSESKTIQREFVEEYKLMNGKKIYVLAEGRLINLAAAEGHPASVMDMSFANQALAAEFIVKNEKKLSVDVHTLSKETDQEIASLKLKALGIQIDKLTEEQKKYLSSWKEGT